MTESACLLRRRKELAKSLFACSGSFDRKGADVHTACVPCLRFGTVVGPTSAESYHDKANVH